MFLFSKMSSVTHLRPLITLAVFDQFCENGNKLQGKKRQIQWNCRPFLSLSRRELRFHASLSFSLSPSPAGD